MKQEEDKFTGLPENAFRELKAGEVYNPLMSPSKNYPEVNFWSVTWGIAMAILFSAAAAYLGLKVGQVFEAAIPIAIIAVGVSGAAKRKNALGENVIIQSIGACSGVIVAGAIFTLPALYILQVKYPEMTVSFMQVFISSLLGGVLGILFLIPFRKYFVSDMHGKYPFPEVNQRNDVAHACTCQLMQSIPCPEAKQNGTANHAVGYDFQGIITHCRKLPCHDIIAAEYDCRTDCPDKTDIDGKYAFPQKQNQHTDKCSRDCRPADGFDFLFI